MSSFPMSYINLQSDNKTIQDQSPSYKPHNDRSDERLEELLKLITVNESGKEVLIPNIIGMEEIYPLVPTRLVKKLGDPYESTKMVFENDLLQQENDYHELRENYEDPLVYHNQQYEFIGEHQLPNFKTLQFNDNDIIPVLASGRDWQDLIKIDIDFQLIPIQVSSRYQKLSSIEDVNKKYELSRWPFITGINTQESAFCHYLLSLEKIRPLHLFFKNDFFMEFKEWPSKTELTKRARILAKLYCKNILSKEQDKAISELHERRRIQQEKEDQEKIQQLKLDQIDHQQPQEIPDPQQIPIIQSPPLQSNIILHNPELIRRIQDLYKQIFEWLEDRTYENYQKGRFKESLDYKRKREEVDRDMVVITNPEQLLRILLLFKMTYKI